MPEDRLAAAIAWAEGVLGPIEVHPLKIRPWAATWRVERPGAGDVFLKCSTAATGHEAAVLQLLTRVCPDLVPELVAADPAGHRLIVADAGQVLRERNGEHGFDLEVWVSLVERFAQLQRAVMPHAAGLMAHGVPDERPERQRALLRAFTTARQLPPAGRERLQILADRWEKSGNGPPASLIPPSIQHGDLHDNNVAVDAGGQLRFFDFGDSSVAHPFSTMDLPLLSARENAVDAAGIGRLEDAYLDAFTEFAPRAELRRELRAVVALAPLQRAHSWVRALSPDGPGGSGELAELTELTELTWDPVAAAEWSHPVEYWLTRLE